MRRVCALAAKTVSAGAQSAAESSLIRLAAMSPIAHFSRLPAFGLNHVPARPIARAAAVAQPCAAVRQTSCHSRCASSFQQQRGIWAALSEQTVVPAAHARRQTIHHAPRAACTAQHQRCCSHGPQLPGARLRQPSGSAQRRALWQPPARLHASFRNCSAHAAASTDGPGQDGDAVKQRQQQQPQQQASVSAFQEPAPAGTPRVDSSIDGSFDGGDADGSRFGSNGESRGSAADSGSGLAQRRHSMRRALRCCPIAERVQSEGCAAARQLQHLIDGRACFRAAALRAQRRVFWERPCMRLALLDSTQQAAVERYDETQDVILCHRPVRSAELDQPRSDSKEAGSYSLGGRVSQVGDAFRCGSIYL